MVLVARRKEKLLQVQKEILQYTDSTLVHQCDVSNKSQVKEMADTVLDTFDRIDVLVNNAGFVIYGKVSELTIEEIESQMETNYFGMIYCTKNFLPHMIEQGKGHIVNIASVGASFGVPGIASYCATKFAMLGFSEGLKHELSGTGVDVTVVSPIRVDTPLLDHPSFGNLSLSFFSSYLESRKSSKRSSQSSKFIKTRDCHSLSCQSWNMGQTQFPILDKSNSR